MTPRASAGPERRGRSRLWTSAAFIGAALAVAPAAALELSMPDVVVPAGETVTEPIRAKDARGLAALQMRVKFDGKAFATGRVQSGPILANALVDSKCGEGECVIAFASPQAVAGDGDLLVIEFSRKEGATGGSALTFADAKAWSEDSKSVTVAVRAGTIAALAPAAAPAAPPATLSDGRWFVIALASLIVAALALLVALWRGRAAPAAAPPSAQPLPGAGPHFCAACGARLAPGENFCASCGVKTPRVA